MNGCEGIRDGRSDVRRRPNGSARGENYRYDPHAATRTPASWLRRTVFGGVVAAAIWAVALCTALASSTAQEQAKGGTSEHELLLPAGSGAELTAQLCGGCHSVHSFTGLRMSRTRWDELVGQMISQGALIRNDESDVIVRYLAEVFGPDSPPLVDANKATKLELERLSGLTAAGIDKLLEARERQGKFQNIKQVQEILGKDTFGKVSGYLTVK